MKKILLIVLLLVCCGCSMSSYEISQPTIENDKNFLGDDYYVNFTLKVKKKIDDDSSLCKITFKLKSGSLETEKTIFISKSKFPNVGEVKGFREPLYVDIPNLENYNISVKKIDCH